MVLKGWGVNDNSKYALIQFATGNVTELRTQDSKPRTQNPGPDFGTTIKNIFAIAMSAATIVYLAHQIK